MSKYYDFIFVSFISKIFYIKKDLDNLLAFKSYEEFNNSDYKWVYEGLLEELAKAETKKGKLKEKDLNKESYDLNRSDIAILWKKQLYFVSSFEYSDNCAN